MCGRYTLANPNPRRLRLRFGITEEAEIDEEPRFNIAPTDPVLAVRERSADRELGTLRWGLIPGKWATEKKGRPLINARAETIATQPAFAESFRERRCLIPADGFYEWRRDENGKVPVWAHLPDDELFAFAGVWASYTPKGAEPIVSCSIVTTAPNDVMRPIHDRMPVILPREAEAEWLAPDASPDDLARLMSPFRDGLEIREVSDLVNNVREDGPSLIEPRAEATLF
ncbi:MAG TPA: SOS response-associated peptidase [Solirubrobacterales bacterium]|nr:SOS response-associated peptidase [Solirubrobacterales bacterium]